MAKFGAIVDGIKGLGGKALGALGIGTAAVVGDQIATGGTITEKLVGGIGSALGLGQNEAKKNVLLDWIAQLAEIISTLLKRTVGESSATKMLDRFVARSGNDPDSAAGQAGGNDPSATPGADGPDGGNGGPDNDNGGLGLGTLAAGAGVAGAGYVGYRAWKNRGGTPGIAGVVDSAEMSPYEKRLAAQSNAAKAAASVADDVPDNIGRAAAEAGEGGWGSKLRGGFKRSAIGAALVGTIVYATSDKAHAAENTVKAVVPFADSFEKAAQGDKTGAARSATIEGVGLAASVGTGMAVGAAVGSVVPVAGTAVGAVVGTVAGVAGYVVGSGVAESAWDSLASYFNGKADPSSAPAPMVARTDLNFGNRQPAMALS